jgi:hypothetical protein
MASLISAYRDVLWGSLQGGPPGLPGLDFLVRTTITSVLVLTVGYLTFTRYSRVFGEEV